MNSAAKAAAQESSGSSAWTSIMAAELQLPCVFIYRCRLWQPTGSNRDSSFPFPFELERRDDLLPYGTSFIGRLRSTNETIISKETYEDVRTGTWQLSII